MITTALIGSLVAHSVSPVLFKLYADEHNLEYTHKV
jgi:shikimate 5-dehydrogenase